MESCAKHPHESGVALCDRCGESWCAACLVYARGPKKAPYCMECAMFAGGVRSAAARPALTRREMKARRKQVEADKPDKTDERSPVEPAAAIIDADAPATIVSSSGPDWSSPWWEDREPSLAD